MRLVDDVNLEAVARGPVAEVLDDRAGVIDLAISRAVDFRNVERASGPNLDARRAFAAGVGSGTALAIKASREDARRSRLADAADPGEEERVRDTPALHRLGQGAGDMLLADQLAE